MSGTRPEFSKYLFRVEDADGQAICLVCHHPISDAPGSEGVLHDGEIYCEGCGGVIHEDCATSAYLCDSCDAGDE